MCLCVCGHGREADSSGEVDIEPQRVKSVESGWRLNITITLEELWYDPKPIIVEKESFSMDNVYGDVLLVYTVGYIVFLPVRFICRCCGRAWVRACVRACVRARKM